MYNLIKSFNKKFIQVLIKFIVFGSNKVLITAEKWSLNKKSHFFLNRKILRLFFQLFILDYFLKKSKVDILLSATGDYVGNFRPYFEYHKICFSSKRVWNVNK